MGECVDIGPEELARMKESANPENMRPRANALLIDETFPLLVVANSDKMRLIIEIERLRERIVNMEGAGQIVAGIWAECDGFFPVEWEQKMEDALAMLVTPEVENDT